MQIKKWQLEPDMEQQTGSRYVKTVYCHPAYLTYMQSQSVSPDCWLFLCWSEIILPVWKSETERGSKSLPWENKDKERMCFIHCLKKMSFHAMKRDRRVLNASYQVKEANLKEANMCDASYMTF